MKKTPTLFKIHREFIDGKKIKTITKELNDGAEWVSQGLGRAFVKSDGKPILITDDQIYYRIIHKKDSDKKVQPNWIACEREYDSKTNLKPFWVSLTKEEFPLLFELIDFNKQIKGSYELIGENVDSIFPAKSISEKKPKEIGPLRLSRHYTLEIENPPRTFDEIKKFFEKNPFHEGIIFLNNTTGSEFKIRLTDFNIERRFDADKSWKIKEWEVDQRKIKDDKKINEKKMK